jgi:hypothetical protein
VDASTPGGVKSVRMDESLETAIPNLVFIMRDLSTCLEAFLWQVDWKMREI